MSEQKPVIAEDLGGWYHNLVPNGYYRPESLNLALLIERTSRAEAELAVKQQRIAELEAALRFYADKANWVDIPSWDGDPECYTPLGIPVLPESGKPCDCGDTARMALLKLSTHPAAPPEEK